MKSEKPFRIYFMGEETLELQLFNIIEDLGGVLVGCDTRLSLYYEPVKEDGDVIKNLARWIWRMPANLPTAVRIETTLPLIQSQKPDGIIYSSVVGSRNLSGAERLVEDLVKEKLGIPVLSIETGFPGEHTDKVKGQIKSFIP